MESKFETNYQSEKNYWGTEPSKVIREHYLRLAPGAVLDLGAGDGRNAVFLARNGFQVTAVDIAPTGIQNLLDKAGEAGVTEKIEGIVANIVDFQPGHHFDNIISNFTLHFLGAPNLLPTLEKMADLTKPGGVNVVDDFTRNGPFGQNDPGSYVTPEMLRQFYEERGWEVQSLETRLVNTKRYEAPGVPLQHEAVAIVAKKPV